MKISMRSISYLLGCFFMASEKLRKRQKELGKQYIFRIEIIISKTHFSNIVIVL